MEIKFPIGTKKAAELLGCAQRTVKLHCKKLYEKKQITKLGEQYLIYSEQFEVLKNKIRFRK